MRRLLRSAANSWNGIKGCFATEAAFREELILLAIAIPLIFLLSSDIWKRIALLSPIFLLLIIELLNTAIEKLCDKVQPSRDPTIERIKDMGSAAVGLTLVGVAIIWIAAIVDCLRA